MRRLLTVTGPDRPGLIAAISGALAEEGADLEDVSMTRLEGNFAMILVARGGREESLQKRLEETARDLGLYVHLAPAVEGPEEQEANGFVSAVGPNRVGIVAAIAKVLAQHQANILEMETQLLEKTEVPVYMIRIEARVPGDWQALERDLAFAGQTVGVEVRLEPIERADL
jgi:glycine cleavage system transcriptional repressor